VRVGLDQPQIRDLCICTNRGCRFVASNPGQLNGKLVSPILYVPSHVSLSVSLCGRECRVEDASIEYYAA
jgi:hypothetical protein